MATELKLHLKPYPDSKCTSCQKTEMLKYWTANGTGPYCSKQCVFDDAPAAEDEYDHLYKLDRGAVD